MHIKYCINIALHYHQASTAAVSSHDRNVWCFSAKSYKVVHVFVVHISHLQRTSHVSTIHPF